MVKSRIWESRYSPNCQQHDQHPRANTSQFGHLILNHVGLLDFSWDPSWTEKALGLICKWVVSSVLASPVWMLLNIIMAILELKDYMYSKCCKFHSAHRCKCSHISIHAWITRLKTPLKPPSYFFRGMIRCLPSSNKDKTQPLQFLTQPFCKASHWSQEENDPLPYVFRATTTSPAFWSHPLLMLCPSALALAGAPGGSGCQSTLRST